MDIDPHTLQQILEKIEQQIRCPQCGERVPITFHSVKVVASDVMLLQLQCGKCTAYIVLQASLKGVESLSAPPYAKNECANVSTGMASYEDDVRKVQLSLQQADGSFTRIFACENAEAKYQTD